MIDDNNEKVNLQVNKKLLFFPEFVKIFTEILNNDYTEVANRIKTDIFYLQKSAFPCDDALVYAVPWTNHPLQVKIIKNIDCQFHSSLYQRRISH